MVDVAKHFRSACFLRKESSAEILKAILTNWLFIYTGPPDIIQVDQSSLHVSKEMKENFRDYGQEISEAPIEAQGPLGLRRDTTNP